MTDTLPGQIITLQGTPVVVVASALIRTYDAKGNPLEFTQVIVGTPDKAAR